MTRVACDIWYTSEKGLTNEVHIYTLGNRLTTEAIESLMIGYFERFKDIQSITIYELGPVHRQWSRRQELEQPSPPIEQPRQLPAVVVSESLF